ncbi:MAG: hypothetical protein QXR57_07540 [Metallosphaera sp.]|uniref:hypothetical protein n=1 Tax=Metallosphaera sp. TaxID=2020860 RepID=UPI00316A043F
MFEVVLLILTVPLIAMSSLWLRYYRKIMYEALSFPGSDYTESVFHLMPSQSIELQVNGKCVLIVNGVSSWITMRVNGGPKQKVFKVRLLNAKGKVVITNESRVFQVSLIVRCEATI